MNLSSKTILWSMLLGLVVSTNLSCSQETNVSNSPSSDVASQPQNLKPEVFAEDGVAIRGYDPVAYFTEGEPQQGSREFAYEWRGATWHFSSANNRDLFENDPEQYAPQYGGYCAWAVKEGTTAPIDPQAWKIVDGKLYLNLNPKIQRRWQEDIPGNIAEADNNWPGVLNQG